ncbi:MAG TPA: hypothetical protein VIV84_01985 [Burkholderiaceae bacterium]
MNTLAQSAYLNSSFGTEEELPHAGSALENPYVFDASARELKAMASRGLVEILDEHTSRVADELLIDRLRFRRVH